MILNGADTVLLVHAGSGYGGALATAGGENLLAAFAEKIKTCAVPLFVSVHDQTLGEKITAVLPATSLPGTLSEIAAIRQIFTDNKIAHIAVVNGVFPLLDLRLTEKIAGIHREYRADISYGENLPAGMAPYFVSRDLLESLEIMEAKDADVDTAGLRPFVEKNINQFHAEVHYEEPDLRLLRLDFSLATPRSATKAARFLAKLAHNNEPYAELEALIQSEPGLLHTFPSYIELEFSSTAEHVSFFSPLKYIAPQKHLLSDENFSRVKDFISTGLGDTSVCASGLGEPLEHPRAREYLEALLNDGNIRYVFLETNGIHLDKILGLAAHPAAGKLRVIVLLNSLERYAEYSGAAATGLEKIKLHFRKLTDALRAAGKNPQEIVYLQSFKVEENEAEIDALYALAEELGGSFLFQKYNRYAGLMPERRVSDMTPLERYSCWHLRRDLFIRANGDVAFCKQTVDPAKKTARGNLANDTLADLWSNQRADFVANYQGKYPSHLPCADCDEYFTFNF
ncbi:MAG: spiro-SPASM protein [Spirochaetes bacterium]|nr:spiro-SPASM protein [Spirochaetota bacterium]